MDRRSRALFVCLAALAGAARAQTAAEDIPAAMRAFVEQHEITGAVTLVATRDGVTHLAAVARRTRPANRRCARIPSFGSPR